MGYDEEKYNGVGKLLPLIIEEGYNRYDAEREIRKAVGRSFKNVDFGPSFYTFVFTVAREKLITGEDEGTKIAIKWLKGEKLQRNEKQASSLFEILKKTNARYWLNSLICLLNISNIAGLVVLIDDVEVMTERNTESGRFVYTANAVKDTCELFRQIIDDSELLNKFLLILAGKKSLIKDDKRGFKSYEALWMRLQTGLVPSERFNPFSDIVDVDAHLKELEKIDSNDIYSYFLSKFQKYGLKRKYSDNIPSLDGYSKLRAAVIENAMLAEREEA